MAVGQCFTIEPMLNEGTAETKELADGWTVVTADKKRSAQFEHTCLVVPGGVELLTAPVVGRSQEAWWEARPAE